LVHQHRVGTQAVLPLNPNVLTTVLQHVENGALRRQAFVLSQRHSPRALKLLDALLLKRDELAKVLEFPSYAALSLANRMAKKPATVYHFLDDLSGLVKGKADKVHTWPSSLFAPPPRSSFFVGRTYSGWEGEQAGDRSAQGAEAAKGRGTGRWRYDHLRVGPAVLHRNVQDQDQP
jgi:hypothetical protein